MIDDEALVGIGALIEEEQMPYDQARTQNNKENRTVKSKPWYVGLTKLHPHLQRSNLVHISRSTTALGRARLSLEGS